MTQTIVRMYATKEAAGNAVQALTAAGFSLYDIHTVDPAPLSNNDPAAEREATAARIERGQVPRAQARIYAAGVQQGGHLVVVNAPFGTARQAIGTLKGFDPIDSGYEEPATPRLQEWDDAAPLSSAMQWPVLSDNPTPFSDALGIGVLTKGRHSMSQALGWAELGERAAPLSDALHVPTLSRSAAPLSGAMGVPTLSAKAAPLSEAAGLPVLKNQDGGYKPTIGKRLLLNDPAPLSRWLGLPVLWK